MTHRKGRIVLQGRATGPRRAWTRTRVDLTQIEARSLVMDPLDRTLNERKAAHRAATKFIRAVAHMLEMRGTP